MAETARAMADAVRAGRSTATGLVDAALARIAATDPTINAFTAVLAERALAEAAGIDAARAAGAPLGPLAGVPFAVKNLFDLSGSTTLAGSRVRAGRPAATQDAFAVAALRRAGAIVVGALNMDEFACGITTENTHYGPTRNPRDPSRIAGGSSGGSAAAVAAGMVPLSLGTDTGGSIRAPAAMCGIWGLKPTFGRLSRSGVVPFAWSFDHVGPLAADLPDLAIAYDALQGRDAADPGQVDRPVEPVTPYLGRGIGDLRVAMLGGWFAANASAEARAVLATAATRIGARRTVELPRTEDARAAMNVVVMSEAAAALLPDLRERPRDFDPMTRPRLMAGALLPAVHVAAAQRFRAWYRRRVAEVLQDVDVLLAPALPYPAIPIGATAIDFEGRSIPPRPMYSALTAPLSFIGLPVIAMPVERPGRLPLGIQIAARPFAEADAFRVAAALQEGA
ncbi:AtzE family amidohydrolase [Prosthecomicrobium sp. N25]|uniref:AtzE family amidohydrolase n=1 Tax=Prosthecomicrobium sp. N25 TaxID=3129254 RepID=UPI0030768DF5